MKKLLILGVGLVLLASCQKHFEEEHLKYDATKSKALNIALLTGLTTVKHGPIVDSEPVGHSSNGGQGAAMTAGAFDLLTGGGGLGLTTAFMFKIYQPEWENHVFAWMPQDMVKDEAEAANVMCEIFYKAVKEAIPANEVPKVDKPCYNFRAWSDAQKIELIYMDTKTNKLSYNATTQVDTPEKVMGSPFSPNTPAYYWSYMKTSSDTSPHIRNGRNSNPSFEELSPLLPSWVYIYIAPNLKTKEPAYFLNQGKKLYFIKPAARGET